jgi:hypothetical protein
VRYLDATPPGEIPIVVELFLQFERLKASVRGPLAFSFAHRIDAICDWWWWLGQQRVGGGGTCISDRTLRDVRGVPRASCVV